MKLNQRQEKLIKRTFLDYRQSLDFIQNPLVLKSAKGLYYYDTDGKRYFDAIGGIFVASLGHCHPRILEALRRQAEIMTFAPPLHGVSDITLEFVDKLGIAAGGDLNFVKPFSGGSESVESAMKFARQYFKQIGKPGKYKFISRYAGYHGSTFGAMAASGTGPRKTKFEPQMGGFFKVPNPNQLRDRFADWNDCNRFAARLFEDIIVNEDPDTVAAVIVEPIGNTGGIITPTQEYYKILRQICDKYNVLLIFDEIITGFGKTGNMFAWHTYEVKPDILCSGKGLGSGVIPLGAMIAKESIAEAFLGDVKAGLEFAHGNTFAGNPLACAVGIAVLEEIMENKLDKRAAQTGQYLFSKLESLKKFGVVREVRGKGILLGVELVKDTKTNEPFDELGKAMKKTAIANGLIMRIDPSWFAVAPALIAKESDIDEMFSLIEKSLKEALEMVKK
jgi:adenosylmethionine-8-amino-7-oxononanoate aminotransferase